MEFYEFPIPAQLNGDQLKAHIGCDEVYVRENKLVIGGEGLTQAQAESGLASYVYVPPTPLTPAEKLFNATGLTVAEYKALGL